MIRRTPELTLTATLFPYTTLCRSPGMGGQRMDTPQQALADDVARRDALASHDRSLLVEAGAGSGKTAVMAGRIAMMLAEGIAPRSIAAVTFTELAAKIGRAHV